MTGRKPPVGLEPRRPAAPPAKRMTLSSVLEHLLSRGPVTRAPAVSLKRSVASGRQGITEIVVEVPVCDEFPTVDEAVAKLIGIYEDLCARFPLPDGHVRAAE